MFTVLCQTGMFSKNTRSTQLCLHFTSKDDKIFQTIYDCTNGFAYGRSTQHNARTKTNFTVSLQLGLHLSCNGLMVAEKLFSISRPQTYCFFKLSRICFPMGCSDGIHPLARALNGDQTFQNTRGFVALLDQIRPTLVLPHPSQLSVLSVSMP